MGRVPKMPDLFEKSKPERRDFLRARGYAPAVGMTLLTNIPHWTSWDGQTFTEVEAWAREQPRRPKQPKRRK